LIGGEKMKEMFSEHIYRNKQSYSKDIDYGRIAIDESKWCPFLDEEKLCVIQRNLGEDYLSNVCYSFPRVYNMLNGVYELSLSMSCPEAVRKLISSQDPIHFTEQEMDQVKLIEHSSVDTESKYWKKTPVSQLPELRDLSIKILQNRSLPLNDRLIELGSRLYGISQNDVSSPESSCEPIKFNNPYAFRLDFFTHIIESLGDFDENDSPVFTRITDLILDKFNLLDDASPDIDFYKLNVETRVNPFTEEYSYVFEHYLVNFIYQDNFPFSENQSMFDGFVMLVLRYALIQFYLAGIAASKGTLTIDDAAQMIQVHTKIINHHKTFMYNVLHEIKRKEFDSMEFIGILLSKVV
jgi:lysine-N-methylase